MRDEKTGKLPPIPSGVVLALCMAAAQVTSFSSRELKEVTWAAAVAILAFLRRPRGAADFYAWKVDITPCAYAFSTRGGCGAARPHQKGQNGCLAVRPGWRPSGVIAEARNARPSMSDMPWLGPARLPPSRSPRSIRPCKRKWPPYLPIPKLLWQTLWGEYV